MGGKAKKYMVLLQPLRLAHDMASTYVEGAHVDDIASKCEVAEVADALKLALARTRALAVQTMTTGKFMFPLVSEDIVEKK